MHDLLRAVATLQWVIWSSLTASLFVYVGIAYVIEGQGTPGSNLATMRMGMLPRLASWS